MTTPEPLEPFATWQEQAAAVEKLLDALDAMSPALQRINETEQGTPTDDPGRC